MTEVRPSGSACAVLPPGLVAAYAHGELGPAAAWSVEAHVPGCAVCRVAVAAWAQPDRLEHNRSVLLARLALPEGRAGRALLRCGVPEHVTRLLAATPSLRRSWLIGVGLVLVTSVGAARLMTPGPAASRSVILGAGGARLIPFLVLAPLLPLAAVAAAFSARLDPGFDLATAAPVSGIRLLCIRAVAVIGATLVPTMLAALALPGPWWLPGAVLAPALAVCAAALAAGAVAGPVRGAIAAGVAWTAVVAAVGLAEGSPAPVFGPAGQLAAVAVLLGALVMIAARRKRIDFGWTG